MSPQEASSMVEQHLTSEMNMSSNEFQVLNAYTSGMTGMAHVYATQMYHGLPVANAVSNFNVGPSGDMTMHHSFVPDQIMETATPVHKRDAPMIPADQAVLMFAQASGLSITDKLTVTADGQGGMIVSGASFALQPIQVTQKYYQTATGLVHAWDLSVNMQDSWQNAFVDSATGKIVGVSNWTSDQANIPVTSTRATASTTIREAATATSTINNAAKSTCTKTASKASKAKTVAAIKANAKATVSKVALKATNTKPVKTTTAKGAAAGIATAAIISAGAGGVASGNNKIALPNGAAAATVSKVASKATNTKASKAITAKSAATGIATGAVVAAGAGGVAAGNNKIALPNGTAAATVSKVASKATNIKASKVTTAKGAANGVATGVATGVGAANGAGGVAAGNNKVALPNGVPAAGAGGILPATYSVIPMGKLDPIQNKGLSSVTSPWDLNASPNGWHNVAGKATTDLSGNNVIAQSNPNNVKAPAQLKALPRPVNANLQFQFQLDPAQAPTVPANRDAATTNVFYVVNSMHDILYNYGFTEAAGNFQTSNNGKGGAANDAVIANSQDGSGKNNANFASPPDGQPGIMRMFLFTSSALGRDGSLANDVISHEMTHGLSGRLTGGPANANCLQSLESGGMGEGWSDMFALMTSLPDANTRANDVVAGAFVTNQAKGIRMFPFSTSLATNPHVFSDLNKLKEVHNIGEVWTTMLNEVMWNMIDVAGGKTPAAQIVASAGAGTGNTDLMLLLIQGMKMQPCNPTFIQAKNAILAADKAMFAGKYQCAIANGFAKRGLGANAVSRGAPGTGAFTNNQDLPAGCAKTF
ncbi:Fungalysin/Thermolysin Extracellular metalloproteinase 5 [Podochytrium sp. JEL0797]|nr:Fungalysin/Thermolysin Extracellular metalloproteinase 5 [Podochytrium sp. JEL0797]